MKIRIEKTQSENLPELTDFSKVELSNEIHLFPTNNILREDKMFKH